MLGVGRGALIFSPHGIISVFVLEDVTRKSVFDITKADRIPIYCEVIPVSLAYEADETLMCTTAGGIMPITSLNGKPIGDEKVGPITKKIWDGYWAMHYESCLHH